MVATIVAQPGISLLQANDGSASLQPVQPLRSAPQPRESSQPTTSNSSAAGWDLRWRASGQVTRDESPRSTANQTAAAQAQPPAQALPAAATRQPSPTAGRASTAVLRAPATADHGAVQPATYMQDRLPPPPGGKPSTQPNNLQRPQPSRQTLGDGLLPPRTRVPQGDPWSDPFGDAKLTTQDGELQLPPTAGGISLPEPAQADPDPAAIPELIPTPGLETTPQPPIDVPPTVLPPAEEAPSLSLPPSDQSAPAPLLIPEPANPFPTELDEADEPQSPSDLQDTPDLDDDFGSADQLAPKARLESARPVSPEQIDRIVGSQVLRTQDTFQTLNCDELRKRVAERTIRQVSLDISPPFRPNVLETDARKEEAAKFLENQISRVWRDFRGVRLAEGRFIDLAYEQLIIELADGTTTGLPLSDLSEGDLAYITNAWGLPTECRLPDVDYKPRNWLPIQMSWKASNLCHKPLYFQDVNLERYGHTAGPFAQPVVSTAHFFVNIAVLPYKMGIHPPNECQYALGYYRPGNCAPWIIPPVPLSLRGALFQTAAIGAGIGLIP
ncbi:hypothetical protein SH139x_001229 [Planctomycetaceae bacterium SH139]